MSKSKKIKTSGHDNFSLIKIIGVILLFATVFVISTNAKEKAEIPIVYDYDETEQKLADDIKAYVSQYISMPERQLAALADAAVKNYNIIIASSPKKVTDEITDAVKKRIRSIILSLASSPEKIEVETLEVLAAGTTEIIWNAVIEQLELTGFYENEELMTSLQEQINTLRSQKMKVSINASIIDDRYMQQAEGESSFYENIENMSDEELAALAARMGISVDKLREIYMSNDKLKEELQNLRNEMQSELAAASGRQGATGATGAKGDKGDKGEKGEAGAAGTNGIDGEDGKTTYIAYADDVNGTNFSMTPTETSKYVGTCITTQSTQPTDAAQYSNWQEYRSYVITSTTDPDTGVVTVHIN